MPNTLEALTSVRSQLARGLEAYLQSFVTLTAWEDVPAFLFLPDGLSPVDAALRLYQPPNVVNREKLSEEDRARRVAADARGEFGRGADAPSATRWAEERDKVRRTLILGRPGEGKTLLTRLTCRDVALESLALLRERTRPVGEIPIPIWLKFEDVLTATRDKTQPDALQAACDVAVPRAVAGALAVCFQGSGAAPSPIWASEFIAHALERTSTWLFIDALDERGTEALEGADVNYLAALRPVATLPSDSHVVITGRLHEYEHGRDLPESLRRGSVTEYELEPLTPTQQRAFLDTWFDGAPKAAEIATLLEGHPQFRDMATNGLMLTLICATAARHTISAGTRRVNLYNLILRDMVGRARRSNPIPAGSPLIDRRLIALQDVVWSFFETKPDKTSLKQADWEDRMDAASEARRLDAVQFGKDLREAGLLVSPRGGDVRFLHRSFFEFLAGARMARKGAREVIAAVRAHLEGVAWREALIMAIGYLGLIQDEPDQAGAVVDEILSEPPGSAGVAVVLIGDALADAGEGCVPADTLGRLRDALLGVMRNNAIPPKVRAAAGTALGRVGDHRFHGEDLWCLPRFKPDPLPDGSLEPEPLLGFVEIPEGEFWMGSN